MSIENFVSTHSVNCDDDWFGCNFNPWHMNEQLVNVSADKCERKIELFLENFQAQIQILK